MKTTVIIFLIGTLSISCAAQQGALPTSKNGSATLFDNGNPKDIVHISATGNVGIGKINPEQKLEVNGQIHAKEVQIDLKNWPDFVFEEDYDLQPLREIALFIKTHGHLPNIPSATQVEDEGVYLGKMNALLLQKIEELTLHLIEKDEQINRLNQKFESLEKQLDALIIKK